MRLRLTDRLNAIRDTLSTASIETRRRDRLWFFLVRLGIRILKQWMRDRPLQQAAALTYQTVLSLVPILAIAFTLLRAIGDRDTEENLWGFFAHQVLPGMPDVVTSLQSFAENISTNALGGVGLLFTFITSWSLYNSVGSVFNDIWHINVRRRLLYRLLTFYAMVTLLPVLAGASLYWSSRFIGDSGPQFVGPLLIQFLALFLTNKLLPNTVVRWTSALAAALVTGVALELLKLGFVMFAKRILLQNYEGVYGSVGIIPILLIWIYLSWMLVLLGAEIATAVQNMKMLEAEDRRTSGDEPINGLSAAQILALVAAEHQRGGNGIRRETICETFGLTPHAVGQICTRLKARGLIAEVHGDKEGYIPARAPSNITLDDVLTAFRATDLQMASGQTAPALRTLIADLERNRRTRIAGVTIADLQPDLDAKSNEPVAVLATARAGEPDQTG